MIKMSDLLSERFKDILDLTNSKPEDWVDLSKNPIKSIVKKDEPVRQNLFDLVDMAYRIHSNEPNNSLQSPNDVLGKRYDYWEAVNFDDDLDADATIFGRTIHGIKLCGIGHDGNQWSKSHVVHRLIKLLSMGKYWIEASPPLSNILLKSGLIPVKDENKIKSMFPSSKEFNFNSDGSYNRDLELGKRTKNEYIFGNPK